MGHLFAQMDYGMPPYTEQLFASITDRRDYYHQAEVTAERAQSNMLPFAFRPHELHGLSAFSDALQCERSSKIGKRHREKVGDGFGGSACRDDYGDVWFAAFGSLFQGDHLGVEFALEAHESLLKSQGLLLPDNRLLGHWTFSRRSSLGGAHHR
jgi:hypothetical protein